MSGRWGRGGRERESQASSALSTEPDSRFDLTTQIMTWAENKKSDA